MARTSDIRWEGFYNARDLGGLATGDGRVTRPGAMIRSAGPVLVTDGGWRQAHRAGVRTVIDLREPEEVDDTAAPSGMTRRLVPLDDLGDVTFWQSLPYGHNATPLYYPPFLARKADRCAAVMTALARAEPGGVIFHCASGRDRTGLVTLLLLSLAGVDPAVIAADHQLSNERLPGFYARLGREDETPEVTKVLADHGTDGHSAVLATLDGFDAESYLLAAGVAAEDLRALRSRLVD